MKDQFVSFPITDLSLCKQQMLSWVNQFNICCFLDNHQYEIQPHALECIAAAGSKRIFSASTGNVFERLKIFATENNSWLFGHFGYDVKNEIEALHSLHTDHVQFPDAFFFEPETVLCLNEHALQIYSSYGAAEQVFQEINRIEISNTQTESSFNIKSRFSRSEYLETVGKLQQHILSGDCYEITFFFGAPVIDPMGKVALM